MRFCLHFTMVATFTLSLTACSDNAENSGFDPSALSHKLKRVENTLEFEKQYKAALVEYYNNSDYLYPPYAESDSANSAQENADSSTVPVSSTNIQETGVDEADRVKASNETLFVLSTPEYQHYYGDADSDASVDSDSPNEEKASRDNRIEIYDMQNQAADVIPIAAIDLQLRESLLANNMYYYAQDESDQLVISAKGGGYYYPFWYESHGWSAIDSALTTVDVSEPSKPVQKKTLYFSGDILSSRRIDDHLLLATRFFPTIEGIAHYPQSDSEQTVNEDLINSLSLDDLLPKISHSDQTVETLLVAPENCFVPESSEVMGYSPDVITLVSIDLRDMSLVSSLCFVGTTETFYASTDNVYLATTRFEWDFDQGGQAIYHSADIETDIHEFTFSEGQLAYSASGIVEGQLGWNVDRRPFRLSEQDGYLRVISFTAELEEDKSPVRLTILNNNGAGELQKVSMLPNEQHPQALGEPGEMLYGSRFVGERAYLITFRVTDPLYVLDLSDPKKPFVAGELKIDGYSDYLHPLDESLILGLGKDAIPDTVGDFQRGAWYQGVKLSLFDATDPTAPFEVDKLIIGKRGTDSPALRDHHAITYLSGGQSGSPARIAIPISLHEQTPIYSSEQNQPWATYGWTHTGLYLFEIDIESKSLRQQGAMITQQSNHTDDYFYSEYDRSVLAGDAVFYINSNQVFGAFWDTPEVLNGPR